MQDLALIATVPVPKAKALHKSGAKKNKLKKGCRFKGKRILCSPAVAARLNSGGSTRSPKKKKKGSRKGMPFIVAKSPQAQHNMNVFQALLLSRKGFKKAREAGNCQQMRTIAGQIRLGLQYMAKLPGRPSKKNPSGSMLPRNRRYIKEMDRVKRESMQCSAGSRPTVSQNSANRAAYEEFMAREERSKAAANARKASGGVFGVRGRR